jgi:hypothetical protein
MTHHPHVHMIVPGGGISLDGRRWISSRPAFLLPVRVLGALFRRLFLTRLIELHAAGRLAFFGTLAGLADRRSFLRHLAPVRKKRFVVYAKPPFTGPEAVLAYLSRAPHEFIPPLPAPCPATGCDNEYWPTPRCLICWPGPRPGPADRRRCSVLPL